MIPLYTCTNGRKQKITLELCAWQAS